MTSQLWQWKEVEFDGNFGLSEAVTEGELQTCLRQCSAMVENCPKHLQSLVTAWEPQTPTGHTKLRYSIKSHPQPLVQPVHNGQEEGIQCYHFYQTGIVTNNSPSSQIHPKEQILSLLKLSEDRFICTVQLTTQLAECQLRKRKVYALYYWSQEHRFHIHSSDVFCQG